MLNRLLRQHRAKWMIILLFLMPVLGDKFILPDPNQENRNLAAKPVRPHSWESLLKYPGQFELWANDHVGLRDELIGLNNRIRYRLFHQFPTAQVLQGKNGRILLASHSNQMGNFSAIQDVCGYQFHDLPALVKQLNLFGSTMRQQQLDANLLIAPTAPVIYPEDIPDWLAIRCQGKSVPMEMALKDPELVDGKKLFYPRTELLAAKAKYSIFPKTWFHWAGSGPRIAADLSMQRFWQSDLQSSPVLKTSMSIEASDIARLFPGLRLNSDVETVNFSASGIKACHGAICYPQLPGIAEKLWGIHRYRNAQAKLPRLVMITDSFGPGLGPWYARYYQDVIQIATNDFNRLSPTEMRHLKQFLFHSSGAQHLLFVYHDATIQSGQRLEADFGMIFNVGRLAKPTQ